MYESVGTDVLGGPSPMKLLLCIKSRKYYYEFLILDTYIILCPRTAEDVGPYRLEIRNG